MLMNSSQIIMLGTPRIKHSGFLCAGRGDRVKKMQGPRFYLALWLSKAAAGIIGLVAKGRGTNLPGVVALKIDPGFLSHLRGIDPEKTVFITGTNGKSSVTNLLTRTLTDAGYRVVSNLDGANMTPGVAVPLLRNATLGGRVRCDYIIMETDERYVEHIRKQLPAKNLCITNIQKDQVQRNGEPGFIRNKISRAIHPDMTLFLNNDDPNSLCLSGAKRIVPYGVAPHSRSFHREDNFFSVSMPCPKCRGGLKFEAYNLDNVGVFHCPVCGFSNEAPQKYQIRDISFEEGTFCLDGTSYAFRNNTPEFLYSYALASAVAGEFGISPESIQKTFSTFESARCRNDQVMLGKHPLKFFRIKQENSETLQSVVNAIASDPEEKTLLFGFDEYVDFYPPYLNTCYMFDCDFRSLRNSGVSRWVCTSKALGHIGALRFLYDGYAPEKMTILPDSSEQTLLGLMDEAALDNAYLVEEIPYFSR